MAEQSFTDRPELPWGKAELERVLPHRDPFLLLDRLTEWEPGVRAVAEVTYRLDQWFFRGHFPGNPIVPGVILVESSAQVGGLALTQPDATSGPSSAWLAKIRGMRFRQPVRPDELVVIVATAQGSFGPGGIVAVELRSDARVIADGELVVSLGPAE